MKQSLIFLWTLLTSLSMLGQATDRLSLIEAHDLAQSYSPLSKNKVLIPQSSALRLRSVQQSRLPTIQLKADGRIQSETISFPEDAGLPISLDLPLYSFQTYAQAQYLIYDGGINQAQQQLEQVQLEVDKQSLEVDLNGIKEQVNQLFLGILFARKRSEILKLTLTDLGLRKEAMQAAVENGTLLESEVDQLLVRELELTAEIEKVENETRSLFAVLGALIGQEIPEDLELETPDMEDFSLALPVTRPEQVLLDRQKQALAASESMIQASRRPKLSAFANGGVGYPNPLNLLANEVAPYAIGGINFSWNLVDWGKANRDRQLIEIQSQMIDNRKEAFEFGLTAMEGKYREDILGLENHITRDQEIVALQEKILSQLSTQLENGVITTNEYLIQSNAALQARQQLELHQVQLLQTKVNYLTQQGAL